MLDELPKLFRQFVAYFHIGCTKTLLQKEEKKMHLRQCDGAYQLFYRDPSSVVVSE
jgi:hypothetical protein